MDSFLNLAKQGFSAYQASQSSDNVSKTGGHEYNSPHHSGQGGDNGPRFNHDEVVRTAEQHGSGDSSLFSNAMGFVSNNQHAHNDAVDDDQVQEAHNRAYSQNKGSDMSARDMGGAAALQALKSFTSGGGGGGGSQTQLISLAMAEAAKLFDKSGGAASGNKQDAVNGAAMTVMKLLVQSKFSGAMGGGNSGGLGSLMGLASKFM